MNNSQNKKKMRRLSKDNLKTAKRLLQYMTETYKFRLALVFVCIFISSVATISVSLSLKFLLDDFIIPLIGQKTPDFSELYMALAALGAVFLLGVISTFIYTRMMVFIGQGVLKRVRDDMFEHMQTLPIRYFDQRTNGSIMSLYTNDTDTLRQMISQSIPLDVLFYHYRYVYFHDGIKSSSHGSGSCSDRCYDLCNKQDRWKQRQIFCQPADVSGRCDRVCGREDERSESGEGV